MTDWALLARKCGYRLGDVVWVKKFHTHQFPNKVFYNWKCGMIIKKTWLQLENEMGYQLDIDRKTFSQGTYYPERVLFDRRDSAEAS